MIPFDAANAIWAPSLCIVATSAAVGVGELVGVSIAFVLNAAGGARG